MAIDGVRIAKSYIFRNRYEIQVYGVRRRHEILKWVRETFSDDDLVFASSEFDGYGFSEFDGLLTEEQLLLTTLRFSSC